MVGVDVQALVSRDGEKPVSQGLPLLDGEAVAEARPPGAVREE